MCYDGDASDVWDERERTARKTYRCNECFAPIPRGVRYVNIGSLYDRSWITFRVHHECLDLWNRVRDDLCGGHGLIMIGGLEEELLQYDGPESQPYRAQLEAIVAKYTEATP